MSRLPSDYYHNPSGAVIVPADHCICFETGRRPNLPGQRTWWVFCPITGRFASAYALLGAMIECVARGRASLSPGGWDRTFAGGIWYDFDCSGDIFDQPRLMSIATGDMQRRIESYMYTSNGQFGGKPALGFR